jgi:hypothetical protein
VSRRRVLPHDSRDEANNRPNATRAMPIISIGLVGTPVNGSWVGAATSTGVAGTTSGAGLTGPETGAGTTGTVVVVGGGAVVVVVGGTVVVVVGAQPHGCWPDVVTGGVPPPAHPLEAPGWPIGGGVFVAPHAAPPTVTQTVISPTTMLSTTSVRFTIAP